MLIASLFSTFALADTILLDTGAAIDGDLARWEFGGDCQITVTEGGLVGAIVIVPCHRVQSFVRTTPRVPVPIGLEEPPVEEVGAPPLEMHAEPPVVAAAAEEPVAEEPVAEEPAMVEAAPRYEDEPIIPDDPIRAPDLGITPAPLSTSGPTEIPGASRSLKF